MDIVKLSISAGIIAIAAFLLAYIKIAKNKLKRFILRHNQQ